MDYVDNNINSYKIEYTNKNGESKNAYEYNMKQVFERRTELKRQGCTILRVVPLNRNYDEVGEAITGEKLDHSDNTSLIIVLVVMAVLFIVCQFNWVLILVLCGGLYVAWLVIRAIYTVIKYWNC